MQLLDDADAAVKIALVEAERHERAFADLPDTSVVKVWQESLNQLEGNLSRWQLLLGDVGEQVRQASEELNALENELKHTVSAFAAARKFLQAVK